MKLTEGFKNRLRFNPLIQRIRHIFVAPFTPSDLPFILSRIDPKTSFPEQIYWIEQLVMWVSLAGELPSETDASSRSSIQLVRIKFLLQVLNRNPAWKSNLAASLRRLFKETSCLQLFSQTGLHQQLGFWSEGVERIVRKLLPAVPNDANFAEFFGRVFSEAESAHWVEEISGELALQISDLFYYESDEKVFDTITYDIKESLVVLTAMIAGIGLSKDILRTAAGTPHNSPFYQLSIFVNRVIDKYKGEVTAEVVEALNPCLEELHLCRKEIFRVYQSLEEKGVSVGVVYRLDQLQFAVNRMETLLHLMVLKRDVESMGFIVDFISELIREEYESRSLKSLFRTNLRLLSKKIVERAGVTGEHYITTSRREYFSLLVGGLGGGALTVGTTVLKSWISAIKLPFFWDFFGTGIIYAGSFLSIQLCGFTLATKQPSATAAHLAGKLENINTQEKLDEFIDQFKKISRSQFAAIAGNLGMAVPASILVDLVFYWSFEQHIFSAFYANYIIGSLHPFETFTILYAALTGVWLWVSSLIGGWLENWSVYRGIPDAIAQHRGLRVRFGSSGAEKIANWFSHNVSGFGSNTALGFLLAGVPVFSKMFGVLLDVRHVTLSTCSLTLAVCALWGAGLDVNGVVFASLGIVFIGALNFGVSFYLALMVAARAKSLDSKALMFLFREVFKKFKSSTSEFFYPPAKSHSPSQNG